jgi:hypothetical protein
MPGTIHDDFDDEDEASDDDSIDREAPDASDVGDEEDETVPCPYCGKAVHEQAEICHHCGSYISGEDAPLTKPAWFSAAAVLALFGMFGAGLLIWLISRW